MFAFRETRGAVDVAFTDRHGGTSGGPFASLNLAEVSGDDPASIRENLTRVARALAQVPGTEPHRPGSASPPPRLPPVPPPRLVRMRQVHGGHVEVVDTGLVESVDSRPPLVADGLVTDVSGVALMVRVADCVPVLLADVERHVVGAAHVGRQGLLTGIVANTLEAMRARGARQVVAWVGPHVCGRCYEVPDAMRAEVSAVVPAAFAETSWGTPSVDVGAGVLAQLGREGITVADVSRCTREDENLYSYRRQGRESGRMAGLVWIRP